MKSNLLRVLIIVFLGGISIKVFCQNGTETHKLLLPYYGITAGSHYSWYKNSIGNYNLDNLEFIAGPSSKFKINKSLFANISINGGLRKGKTYNKRLLSLNIENLEYVLFEVDKFDRLLSHNYYFLELPIMFEYNIHKKLNLTFGYSIRYYLPQKNQENYSFIFDNKFENGILSGVSINLSRRLFLEGNFNFALKNSYSAIMITPVREYDSRLTRRALQLNILYLFK